MDMNFEHDCSCFPPPPEFNVPPPPKPFGFMPFIKEDFKSFENDDVCSIYLFESSNVMVISDKTILQMTEPFLALVIIATCMIVSLIVGGFIAFWFRKRRCLPKVLKSLPKSNMAYSNYSNSSNVNAKVLINPDNKTNLQLMSNVDMQLYRCSEDFGSKENLGDYPTDYQSITNRKRKLSFSDTCNPMYEEISLSDLPIGSLKSRNGPLDFLNQSENKTLLHPYKNNLLPKICKICESNTFPVDGYEFDHKIRNSNQIIGNLCKCTLNLLSNSQEMYAVNPNQVNLLKDYHHKESALV